VVSFTPRPLYSGERAPGTHWIGGWVDPKIGLDEIENWKFLTLPGLEFRPLGRPARSQSLYRVHPEKEGVKKYCVIYYICLSQQKVNRITVILLTWISSKSKNRISVLTTVVMKGSIFQDTRTMPCSPLKSADVSEDHVASRDGHLLHAVFLFRPWILRCHAVSKRRLTFNGLYGFISLEDRTLRKNTRSQNRSWQTSKFKVAGWIEKELMLGDVLLESAFCWKRCYIPPQSVCACTYSWKSPGSISQCV
jgi:hypothetical protein